MERVESIENLDGRVFYAQGIVSVDAFTRMSIASFRLVDYLPIGRVGSSYATISFFPSRCSVASFAASSSPHCNALSRTVGSASMET